MLLIALMVVIPLAAAAMAWFYRNNVYRPMLLPITATIHLALLITLLASAPAVSPHPWIQLDPIGTIFLLEASLLFAACSFYAVNYLKYRHERKNRVLCAGMLVCLSAMTLASVLQHMGLLWLAIETTTLSMAPLVYFNSNARSIEATWKYMLICSIGIAIALLGLFFLAYSTMVAQVEPTMVLAQLRQSAPQLPAIWLNAAFVFILVGYGTKMGLAPMHTWKPDAYGEAPGLVGAMLAGGLANCGLLGLIRMFQICIASGDTEFYRTIMVGMGLFSVAVAAIFLLRQTDFKRMLAYSSIEHMGLFTLALGLGGKAVFGVMLHVIGNGLCKGVLFLTAGNIHRAFASKSRESAQGTLKRAPWTGALFLLGFFAMTGSPPFAPFISEYMFISTAFRQGKYAIGILIVLLLSVAFLGMLLTILPIIFGDPSPERERTKYRDTPMLIGPPLALLMITALLGMWLPEPLLKIITSAAALLEVPK